jgi:hypothetical protein
VPSSDDSNSYNATRTVSRSSRLESTRPPTHATIPACHHSHSAPVFLLDHLFPPSLFCSQPGSLSSIALFRHSLIVNHDNRLGIAITNYSSPS